MVMRSRTTLRPSAHSPATRASRRRLSAKLERLPGVRNVIVHEYRALDMERVVVALDELEPVERFAELVRGLLDEADRG